MEAIRVLDEIPEKIVEGLESGVYERIGGAIREVDTQQVIAWLREIYELSEPAVSEILSLSATAANANALNLALATMEFAVVMKRLDAIETQLKQMQKTLEAINYKIDLSFYANFRAALDLAANAFTMSNTESRRVSSMQAINRFLEAEHHYADLADIEIANQSQVADDYLSTLCLAYVTEVRCYLELEEPATALQRLQEGLRVLRPRFEQHVRSLLTVNPAAYLHPSIKDQVDLKRLTRVYRWLTPGVKESDVFETLRENLFLLAQDTKGWIDALPAAIQMPVKSRFFDPKRLTEFADKFRKRSWKPGFKGLMGAIPSKGKKPDDDGAEAERDKEDDVFQRLPETMQLIESMIEHCSRYEIYLVELKAIQDLGITFEEWRQLTAGDNLTAGRDRLACITAPQLTV